jgi:hypothetical protein
VTRADLLTALAHADDVLTALVAEACVAGYLTVDDQVVDDLLEVVSRLRHRLSTDLTGPTDPTQESP